MRPRPTWPPGTVLSGWPICPRCARFIHPDAWDAHQDGHDRPPDPPPSDADMDRAFDQILNDKD